MLISKKISIIVSIFVFIIFAIISFDTAKTFVTRTSLEHHEVEYMALAKGMQIKAPQAPFKEIQSAEYNKARKEILDPGGYSLFLKFVNNLILENKWFRKFTSADLNYDYIYFRLLSFVCFFSICLITYGVVYSYTKDILMSAFSLFAPFLFKELVNWGLSVRAFIFEGFFTYLIGALLLTLFKSRLLSIRVSLLVAVILNMWVRFSGTFITPLIVIFLLFFFRKDFVIKKSTLIIFSAVIVTNLLLICVYNSEIIFSVHEKVGHLYANYLNNSQGWTSLGDTTKSDVASFAALSLFLYLSCRKNTFMDQKKEIYLGISLLLCITASHFIASILGLYPFSLDRRFSISIQVIVLLFFVLNVSNLLCHLRTGYQHIYSFILILPLLNSFKSENYEGIHRMNRCNLSVYERKTFFTDKKLKVFQSNAWYELWYHLELGVFSKDKKIKSEILQNLSVVNRYSLAITEEDGERLIFISDDIQYQKFFQGSSFEAVEVINSDESCRIYSSK